MGAGEGVGVGVGAGEGVGVGMGTLRGQSAHQDIAATAAAGRTWVNNSTAIGHEHAMAPREGCAAFSPWGRMRTPPHPPPRPLREQHKVLFPQLGTSVDMAVSAG